MSYMFADCNNLKKLDLTAFNTENVKDMDRMFYSCQNLISLDLSSFDTQRCKTFTEMFANIENIKVKINTTKEQKMIDNCDNQNVTFIKIS